ncbi:MAG: hydantoinase B/oxoprolinase family protein, partial [Alphaproteobacteria bacterium]
TDPAQLVEDFVSAHQQRFGFRPDTRDLLIEMLEVEGVGETGQVAELTLPLKAGEAHLGDVVIHLNGHDCAVPVYDRDFLTQGQTIDGPILIIESTGTTMVEPGWQAECLSNGNLLLRRTEALVHDDAIGTKVDPIMLEVFNNQFMSIAEQMGATLENTAYSVNIKERLDFSCALFDERGDLVANAPHVPVHLGSMSESVKKILDENRGDIRPGDVFMMNNPFNGGTHLPDVTVITPVFDADGTRIVATVASRGHHADIGGRTPGSAPPDSRHITEEGVVIDNFRLVAEGVLQEQAARALLLSGDYPCRNVDQNMADLAAQIAANSTGEQALADLIDAYGLETVHAYMDHVQDNAEESVRRVIDVLSDAAFTQTLDSGAQIKVAITVDKNRRSARIDFTGTSDQDALNYNAPSAICRAVVLYVFRTMVGKNIPMNEGCLKPLELVVPAGSMINPRFPAAVISGNTEVSQAIAEALYGALQVMAGSQGTMNNFVYGNERLQNYETICGGTGAGPDFDGASAVHSHMTNTRMTDPEVLERRFPVRVEQFAIRGGSGGEGQHRGGDGIVRQLRFLEDMTVTVLTSNRIRQPHGAQGGQPGMSGINSVLRQNGDREHLTGNDRAELRAGDAFIMETPGGGGYGRQIEP